MEHCYLELERRRPVERVTLVLVVQVYLAKRDWMGLKKGKENSSETSMRQVLIMS